MSECTKATQCTRCIHRGVCSFTEDFLTAQQAVDNLDVTLKDKLGRVRSIYLRNIEWIKAVDLECMYFMAQQS